MRKSVGKSRILPSSRDPTRIEHESKTTKRFDQCETAIVEWPKLPIGFDEQATLTIGLDVRRDVTMSLETLQESITVIAQAPVVETTRSEVAQVVTQQQIESLPVNSRQAITLALLLPGTSQDGTRPRKVNATVGSGSSHFSSAFLVDGVTNQQTSAGEPRQDFPQGGIQEFKVHVSQAPAPRLR